MMHRQACCAALVLIFVQTLWTSGPYGQVQAFTACSLAGSRQRGRCGEKKRPSLHSYSSWRRSDFPLRSSEANSDAEIEIQARLETPAVQNLPDPEAGSFRSDAYVLICAAIVGALSGWSVGLFKLSIEAVRQFAYGADLSAYLLPLIPALGGVFVGALSLPGAFPPGLRGTVTEVDDDSRRAAQGISQKVREPFSFLRKSLASVFTLGTGSSLGPEGPSVEVGMSMSRITMNLLPPFEALSSTNATESTIRHRNRLLLACGAAAGVSAGFNAPLAGVFFALEIVENAFEDVLPNGSSEPTADSNAARKSSDITSILIASVLSALVSRSILGDHLALIVSDYTLRTPLLELPLYLLLGATCGVVAFAFSQVAKLAKSLFDGEAGPTQLRNAANFVPNEVKPIIGGLLCGLIGLAFPQILFFGYETLNALLAKSTLPTMLLLTLLVVKTIATALAAGSGLVGGTFAPALFLGAMTGAAFHNIMAGLFQSGTMQLADVPAYAMVGAACLLAALFRAPLTASLLLFELTRDYDVILPLMASAGVGSVVGDIIEAKVEGAKVRELRRDKDDVSWGDLADKKSKK